MAYDPGIAQNFRRFWLPIHANLWRYWDRITCPVLILRGSESDFLTTSLLERMVRRLPHAEVVEFDGVGHTPTLNATEQIAPVVTGSGTGNELTGGSLSDLAVRSAVRG